MRSKTTLSKDGYKFIYVFRVVDKWENIEVVNNKIASEIVNKLNNYNKSSVFKTIENIDAGMSEHFAFISETKITSFYFLDWPIFFRQTVDNDEEENESKIKWRSDWKRIFDITFTKDPILDNKCITFEYRLNDNSVYPFAMCYHKVSILKGKNCFYLLIDLAGSKRHYKCRNIDSLVKCMITEKD